MSNSSCVWNQSHQLWNKKDFMCYWPCSSSRANKKPSCTILSSALHLLIACIILHPPHAVMATICPHWFPNKKKNISLFKHYKNTGWTSGDIKSGRIWHWTPMCGDWPAEDRQRKSTATSLEDGGRTKDKEIFHHLPNHPSIHPTCAKLPFLPTLIPPSVFSLSFLPFFLFSHNLFWLSVAIFSTVLLFF